MDPTSDLVKLFEKASIQSPDERAQSVIDAKFLRIAHQSSAEAGQSQAPSADDDVNLHFVAFVQAPAEISDNIRLIELDGRKHAPIDQLSLFFNKKYLICLSNYYFKFQVVQVQIY